MCSLYVNEMLTLGLLMLPEHTGVASHGSDVLRQKHADVRG